MSLRIANSLYIGILIGIIMPLISYFVVFFTDWSRFFGNKPLTIYVLAALLNLLLMRYFYRNEKERVGQGVILITFLGTMVLIFTKTLVL